MNAGREWQLPLEWQHVTVLFDFFGFLNIR